MCQKPWGIGGQEPRQWRRKLPTSCNVISDVIKIVNAVLNSPEKSCEFDELVIETESDGHLHHLISCEREMECGICARNFLFDLIDEKIWTLWEPTYNIFVPRIQPKNSSFRLPHWRHRSYVDCARELFKGSNESASLLVCTRKNFFGWGLQIFCEWRHKWSGFEVILAHVTWPRAQPPDQSLSLKFSLETRLESESLEPLINFVAFLGQKLWSKINKLINYLIN